MSEYDYESKTTAGAGPMPKKSDGIESMRFHLREPGLQIYGGRYGLEREIRIRGVYLVEQAIQIELDRQFTTGKASASEPSASPAGKSAATPPSVATADDDTRLLDPFAVDRATAAPQPRNGDKEDADPEPRIEPSPQYAAASDRGSKSVEEEPAGDASRAEAAIDHAESTSQIGSAPKDAEGAPQKATSADSGAKHEEEFGELFAALKVDASAAGTAGDKRDEAKVAATPDAEAPATHAKKESAHGDAAVAREHHAPSQHHPVKKAAGEKIKAIVNQNAAQANESKGATPPATVPGSSRVATGANSWERFVFAIGMKESGNAAPDAEGIVGTDLKNASGIEGSYGRFQTVASSAVSMLEHDPELRSKYGFSEADVADLRRKVNAVEVYYTALVGRSGKDAAAKQTSAQKRLRYNEADVEEAKQYPKEFIAKHGAEWTAATGLDRSDLDRLLGCIDFRELIREYRSTHPLLKGDKNKKARMEAARQFFAANEDVCKRIHLGPGDIAAYISKGKEGSKEGIMAENLAGFQMKAAGGRQGHLSKAINADGAVGFGKKEVEDVRKRVVTKAHNWQIALPTSDEQLYMLCAREHNGGLTKEEIKNPALLEKDEYVSKVMAIYRGGAAHSPETSKLSQPQHQDSSKIPLGPAPAKMPSTPAGAGSRPAAQHDNEHHVKRTFWEKVEFWKSDSDIVAERLKERGHQLGAPAVGTEKTAVHNAQSTSLPSNGAGALGAHLPSAGAAYHEGSKDHAIGEGDQVFDGANVIAAFPTSPEGVVAAALYELHRGDTRSLAEIAADPTKAKTERGVFAAEEGGDSKHGTNDDKAGSQHVGHKVKTKHGKKGKPDKIEDSGDLGPIEAYIASVGVDPHAGIPWCGSFATFVYMRAGIKTPSLAFSLDVPNVLAAGAKNGGQYFQVTGDEGTLSRNVDMGRVDRHGKHILKHQKQKAYRGELQAGKAGDKQSYSRAAVSSVKDLDIRPGDVFWQQHSPKSGHVGIIIGVAKTEREITIVTVEGNASNKVQSKVVKLFVEAGGKITSPFKGWGRPPELGGDASPANDDQTWIKSAEDRFNGIEDSGSDR